MACARWLSRFIARRVMSSSSSTKGIAAAVPASVRKIDARVFCLGSEGGNPVTVFASPTPLPEYLQRRLAKSCDWESVLVETNEWTKTLPTMAFFMPSGEEVSFCAHAAIGGAIAMGGNPGSWKFAISMTRDSFSIDTKFVKEEGNEHKSRLCCLQMKGVRFDEAPLGPTGITTLKDWGDRLGWSIKKATEMDRNLAAPLPTNASVARPKTLVRLESVNAVQRAEIPPSDGRFTDACALMDDSTGVYLYAPIDASITGKNSESFSYECRQFPRASGYPEDPATGIAAAALAASLRFGIHGGYGNHCMDVTISPTYNFYQGTAMGRPSLIQVSDLWKEESGTTISFGLQGRVEVDKTSMLQLNDCIL